MERCRLLRGSLLKPVYPGENPLLTLGLRSPGIKPALSIPSPSAVIGQQSASNSNSEIKVQRDSGDKGNPLLLDPTPALAASLTFSCCKFVQLAYDCAAIRLSLWALGPTKTPREGGRPKYEGTCGACMLAGDVVLCLGGAIVFHDRTESSATMARRAVKNCLPRCGSA